MMNLAFFHYQEVLVAWLKIFIALIFIGIILIKVFTKPKNK